MLDYVLVDGLDERIIRNCLDEDSAVFVFGVAITSTCIEIYISLKQVVMDIQDGLEPRQTLIMDMVCLSLRIVSSSIS